MQHYYTVREVADIYCVSERTVRNWIRDGVIEACRPGGRILRIDSRSCDRLNKPIRNII